MKLLALLPLAIVASALVQAPAAADCLTPQATPAVASAPDQVGRAVAAVYVNDQGPFRFIVDTGANRSVLSAALAGRLGLSAYGVGEVHTVDDVQIAPLVRVDSLRFGAVALSHTELPILDGPVLAGEQGMLGFDDMRGRRLQVNFAARCVEVVDAASAPPLSWPQIQGQLRFGSMLMAQGDIQGVKVVVLIDTGSNVSLCNHAFRTALEGVRADFFEFHSGHVFTAGRPLLLNRIVWTPRLRLGRFWVSNITAYEGEYHIFDLWGLQNQPTVLLGMDVLGASGAMAVDYAHSLIYFREAPHGPSRFVE